MSQDTARRQRRSAPWGAADIPSQDGRIAVITGANSGIGYEAARFLAWRDAAKTAAAAGRLTTEFPEAQADTVALDLASLESVRAAADEIRSRYPRLDLLVNNAGVMMPPY